MSNLIKNQSRTTLNQFCNWKSKTHRAILRGPSNSIYYLHNFTADSFSMWEESHRTTPLLSSLMLSPTNLQYKV